MKNIISSVKLLYKISPVLMISLLIFTITSLFISPLFSLVDKFLFDTLQQGYNVGLDAGRIFHIVLLYFSYNFGVFVLYKTKDYINTYSDTVVGAYLQKESIRSISKIDYDQFEDNEFYNYITTVQNEIRGGNILGIYRNTVILISIFVTTIFLVYLLLPLSAWAALVSLFSCVPGFLHQAFYGKKNWEFNTSKIPHKRKMTYIFNLLSSVGAYKENRIYDTLDYYKQQYSDLFDEYYKELKSFNRKNCWKGILTATFHAIGTVSVIAYAYYQAANGIISLGDAVLYVGVSQSIYNNIQSAIYTISLIKESSYSINNILELLLKNEQHECSMEDKLKVDLNENKKDKNSTCIELSNITYVYPGTIKPVLSGLSLYVNSGEKLAIVGENGSGKSTLAKIILGLYNPQEGIVKINGRDIKTLPDSFRYSSVSFQDYYTYSLSVRENVAFGNIEKLNSDEDIYNVIDMSRLERKLFDNNLDKQVTKVFDTDGIVLSGGQSQKMSLARAFMFDRGLIILDEPSASLDVETENEIFGSTLKLMQDRTTIVITHRLANIVHCDRIIYIESGKVVEEGTHSELMKLNGRYAELFSIQARKYIS